MSRRPIADHDAFYAGFKPVQIQRPELKVGDRIIVTDRSHPHFGETAEVTTAPRMVSILGMAPRMWLEATGDWNEFGVQPHQVRRIADLNDQPRRRVRP